MGKVVKNKNNSQLSSCFKKSKLKKVGISTDDLMNMKVDVKLKKILWE